VLACELPQKRGDRNQVVASDKNPTEGEVGEVQRASRHDLVRALAPRHGHVRKSEKTEILDQLCEVTGYTRKYALTLLKEPPEERGVKRTRRRSPSYGPAEVELLRLCWLVTDGICSKRLAPFLRELLDRLRRRQALRQFPVAVQARVAGMSAATVDRALKPLREQAKTRRGVSTTKAGTLLKRQIAIRTFADWTEARPGFLEMDLVAHCGWSGAGQFLYTLSMVDVATGWIACAGLRDKRRRPSFMRCSGCRPISHFASSGSLATTGPSSSTALCWTIAPTKESPSPGPGRTSRTTPATSRRKTGPSYVATSAMTFGVACFTALGRIHDLARDYVNFVYPVGSW
jgi:hypothetical protein